MEIRELELEGVKELTPRRFGDTRGFFSETYNKSEFENAGLVTNWVQDNHSFSVNQYVLRGLHFQTDPFAQDKLVRVLRGEVFDVAIDIRTGSPNFGKWVGITLTAEKGNQILIPRGFAHGFLTLTHNADVAYKVTNPYAPDCDRSIAWNDATIGIDWPLPHGVDPHLSEKDKKAPLLADVNHNFGA